jgi:hypothetical protein
MERCAQIGRAWGSRRACRDWLGARQHSRDSNCKAHAHTHGRHRGGDWGTGGAERQGPCGSEEKRGRKRAADTWGCHGTWVRCVADILVCNLEKCFENIKGFLFFILAMGRFSSSQPILC